MIKNYFKTAFRNLWKNKTFGFLNILGLGIGITCAALIMLWVENEVTYNSSIPNKENIYQLLDIGYCSSLFRLVCIVGIYG